MKPLIVSSLVYLLRIRALSMVRGECRLHYSYLGGSHLRFLDDMLGLAVRYRIRFLMASPLEIVMLLV